MPKQYHKPNLILSCALNQTTQTLRLLQSGCDVNVKDLNRSTPLHWSVFHQNIQVVQLLIQCNASQTPDQNGIHPLHLAALVGNEVLVMLLGLTLVRDNKGITPLHLAAFCGHDKVVRILCEGGNDPNVKDNELITPIHLAASCNYLSTVKLLLEYGADIYETDSMGRLSHHWAAVNGSIPMLKLLLLPDTSAVYEIDRDCNSLLKLATLYGHYETVAFLLEIGGHLDVNGGNRITPILQNLESFDEFLVRIFPKLGSNISTLHWSMGFCTPRILNLFREIGVDLNLTERLVSIASVHIAAAYGNLEMMKALVQDGAGLTLREKWYLMTPLDCAIRNGYFEMVEYLLKIGVSANSNQPRVDSPLHLAAKYKYDEIVKLLISHGANVQALGTNQCPPICVAVKAGSLNVVKALVEAGASLNPECTGPPIIAALNKQWHVLRYLLERGTNAQNLIHTLTLTAPPLIIERINLDVNTPDKEGRTCFDYILQREDFHSKVLWILWNKGLKLPQNNAVQMILRSHLTTEVQSQLIRLLFCFGVSVDTRLLHSSSRLDELARVVWIRWNSGRDFWKRVIASGIPDTLQNFLIFDIFRVQ